MRNLNARVAAAMIGGFGMLFAANAAPAAILGPDATACAPGAERPAMLVHIEGLHGRQGTVRVQAYGGDPALYFEKGAYLARVDVPLPANGPVEICVPVPKPGAYALSVKHDVSGDGSWGLNNGGGFSGNPPVSAMDVVMKRKPAASAVQIAVRGLTNVPVKVRYLANSL